jgi:protein tyrosine phosphatase (PTP) superfamily phosphohydrolase (DUF442 family)
MAKFAKATRRAIKRITLGWRQSVAEQSPEWVRRSFGPPASYLDMLFVDHGIFRLIYVNRHRVGARAWRSAQPAPHHIRALARRGIRTVVNLRGERLCGSYWLEREACRRYGIELVNFQVRSRDAPSREELKAACDLFERIQYPMLMHCKSGADRAGLMSALYLFVKEGVPLDHARRELSLRYGHFRQADTGVLDYFFDRYFEDNARCPMPFFEWVETVYDPDELKRSFRAQGWANRIVGSVLRRE